LGLSEGSRTSSAQNSWGIIARGRGEIGSLVRFVALCFPGNRSVFSLDKYPQSPIFIFLHLSCSANEYWLEYMKSLQLAQEYAISSTKPWLQIPNRIILIINYLITFLLSNMNTFVIVITLTHATRYRSHNIVGIDFSFCDKQTHH
jgi:hypothetical protein